MTGGAGGIGGSVVKLLAEKKITVVVLDVIPMTFEARKLTYKLSKSTPAEFSCSLQCPLLQVRHHLHLHNSRRGSRNPQHDRHTNNSDQ